MDDKEYAVIAWEETDKQYHVFTSPEFSKAKTLLMLASEAWWRMPRRRQPWLTVYSPTILSMVRLLNAVDGDRGVSPRTHDL